MTCDLTLVLIDLVKFLAPEYKAKHRLLSVTATPFVPQGLDRNDNREEAESYTKVESIINDWTGTGRIF